MATTNALDNSISGTPTGTKYIKDDFTFAAPVAEAGPHTHPISEITNLQTSLDVKASSTHSHAISDVTNLQTSLDGKAASSHSHAIADVTNLQTTLDAKAASSHTHAISDVTSLQASLDAKAPLASPAFTGTPTGITKAHVGLGNVDNTSDASKPISTATQTALDGKSATSHNHALNNLSEKSYNSLTDKPVIPYTLFVQALTSNPVDAQTVYFGNLPKAPVTAAAISKVYIPKSGTIKRAEIYCYSAVAGTAENWSLNIRLNNTIDTLIQTVGVSASERRFSNTSLNIAVVAGDYIEIKSVQPTWVTNPTGTIFGGYIYIE